MLEEYSDDVFLQTTEDDHATLSLDDIESQTAMDFMTAVQFYSSSLGSTGIRDLDDHIVASGTYHPTPNCTINRGDVIEIQGSAGSGKTQLSYHFTMKCVLPDRVSLSTLGESSSSSRQAEIKLGGWNKAAIILDVDGRWKVSRLRRMIYTYIKSRLPSTNLESYQRSLEELTEKSLKRVHIFRPSSSLGIAATFIGLPDYLALHLPEEELGLVVIDSLSAFYWIDKFTSERKQRRSRPSEDESSSKLHRILVALQEFRISYAPAVVITNWGLTSIREGSDEPPVVYFKQHLHPFPSPFEDPPRELLYGDLYPPITHHVTLPLSHVVALPDDLGSVEEAVRAGTAERNARVKRSDVQGFVRTPGYDHVGKFIFAILEDAVVPDVEE